MFYSFNLERLPDPAASHATREYLAVFGDASCGGTTPVPPKQLAVADPAARWTAASRQRAFFAYATNDHIDLRDAVIVDVEATTVIRQVARHASLERASGPIRVSGDTESRWRCEKNLGLRSTSVRTASGSSTLGS